MTNVKLAIRVRPFTDKELKSEKERIQVVSILDEHTVTITNIKVSMSGAGDSRERVRRYQADFTFDSACAHTQPTMYASQEKVFDTIGRQVLTSVSRGSSACVMAYGQSATGKTHTMMGTEAQPGLIPRICRTLAEEQPLDISVSFLEIYNERVHDLLVGEASAGCQSLPRRRGNARKDLRVREHPARGPYVQNLRRVTVHDVESLLSVVHEGARRRRTAATRRNPTSSRSHALLELATPHATLHLADLAGSEKASWEGCGGGRQKEGANINKSLVALSNVIAALVRGGRGRYVPYRDSTLTWLLKDCFTGGAPTFIIATVSPSYACYGESASTLRWAEQARQLPVPRATNTAYTTSKSVLQAQFNRLLAELASQYIKYAPETGKITYDDRHWTVINTNNIDIPPGTFTELKIGNIMSISNPKSDVQNSESTPSSVASGSSDVINLIHKNIDLRSEISKEVDKLFGPTLERTQSGTDLTATAPEMNKRQYKSQEVLTEDKTLPLGQSLGLTDSTQMLSEINIDEAQSTDEDKNPSVPIVYESDQRADIVASVTERLYSKLKKREVPAARVESVSDKKITQPLSELRICTNARQRLVELSQRALRNKRRIGIPVHTQTKRTVIRVKDQEIDVQNDLQSYAFNAKRSFVLYRDVSTETIPMTPRFKEIAVGPTYGSINVRDRSTNTDIKKIPRTNSVMMTDIVKTVDFSTQTPVLQQPSKRKKRSTIFARLLRKIEKNRNDAENNPVSPIIHINISPTYPDESQTSEDNRDKMKSNKKKSKRGKSALTPDLLTNHSSTDQKDMNKSESFIHSDRNTDDTDVSILTFEEHDDSQFRKSFDDFPETEDNVLPRVVVSPSLDPTDIKDMILGRNENSYPYNILLSPTKMRDENRKIIRFKEIDITPAECCKMKYDDDDTDHNFNKNDWINYKNSRESVYSDCSSSSKLESDTLNSRKGRPINQSTNTRSSLRRNYLAVPKSNMRYKIARAKLYKEFLGLEKDRQQEEECLCSPPFKLNTSDITEDYVIGSQDTFRQRRQFFENKFRHGYYPQNDTFRNIERKIIASCNKLELSADRYRDYLHEYKENKYPPNIKPVQARTPTEYLQHLVKLRREVIQANSHRTESFV